MNEHEKINYLEFPASDLGAVRRFFESVFGWEFTAYGGDYMDSNGGGMMVGFYRVSKTAPPALTGSGSVLVTFYSDDLAATETKIKKGGGTVIKPTFAFPGGRRFQFTDPSGNEWAVWSDKS